LIASSNDHQSVAASIKSQVKLDLYSNAPSTKSKSKPKRESNTSIMMKVNKNTFDYDTKNKQRDSSQSPSSIKPTYKKSGLLS